MLNKSTNQQARSAFSYLLQGAKLLRHPKLRIFVLIPFLINLIIFGAAFWFLFTNISDWITGYLGKLPEFLTWLSYIIWPLLILTILIAFSFIFSTLANIIAAPFNGLLAEKTENILINGSINDDGMMDLMKDLPRIFKREMQKLVYILPRMLLCAALFFIPAFGQTIAPIIWFVFGGWMMVIQYADYPFDNHKIAFDDMKKALRNRPAKSLTFGMVVSFFNAIPILNFIIMPIAVCGATAFWVDIYKAELLENKNN